MMLQVNRTFLSPNRSSGWQYGQPNKVVIHSTRSGVVAVTWTHDKEMGSTINWFLGTNSSASSNLVISPTEIVRMVPDEFPSWHAKEHSWQAWGIEMTQPLRDTPYQEGHYINLVRALRHYHELGVAYVHLPTLVWGDTASGIIGHQETAQGLRDGKSDPGQPFDWTKLLAMLTEEGDMPLSEEDIKRIARAVRDEQTFVKPAGRSEVYRLDRDAQVLVHAVGPDVFGLQGDFGDLQTFPATSPIWKLRTIYPGGVPPNLL